MSNKTNTSNGRQASIESRAQTFWLKSPEGEELIVTNLKPWCRERNLDASTFIKVAKGKVSNSKGWLCRYYQDGQIIQPENDHTPRTKNKLWTIIGPDGIVYDDVTVLKTFCAEHGLSYGAMKEIGEGKRTSTYKGWKLIAKTPDFSGVKTAFLEQKAAQEAAKAAPRAVETITGETRECIEFPTDLRIGEGICYVYKLTCLVHGKVYIGVSVNPAQRFGEHARYAGSNVAISNSIKKHGAHKFDKEILLCGPVEYCFEMEDACINVYNSHKDRGHGYNQREGGLGTSAGTVFGPEFAAKISAALKGKSRAAMKDETKEKIRLGNIGKNSGKTLTEEHRKKIGAAQKGKPKKPDHAAKLAEHLDKVRPK